ncbi:MULTISPECIES: hypothetical protein [Bacillaceae]|uniref:hypothetical protein n=1 Tax=Bacillaceae TaxID=186817 RepID=UPI00047A6002|nr:MULTISPECIES: hypothetical protein [Bacillaceae]MBI0579945.1 hypothetical protein [Neobacillus cucumis]
MKHDEFWNEFNAIKKELMEVAQESAEKFWAREDLTRDEVIKSLIPRDWLEIAYVFFLGTQLNKYWHKFDRGLVTAMCKHMWDEARHYELISRIIEKYGYTVPTAPPEQNKGWDNLHWEALEKDFVCAVAVWNVSETSTVLTMDLMIDGCRRIGLDDLARVYEQIKKDEEFHTKLGETIVQKYCTTDELRANAIWGARKLRENMIRYWQGVFTTPAVS